MPSSDVLRYHDRGHATAASATTPFRHHQHRAGGNNSRGTSTNSSSSVLSPTPQNGRNRGQLKKLYQQRNPDHDVDGYLTTRKLEQKTIKNREKRVRRQYVLEDGRVIEEGDPEIFVDRVEDTLTREEEHEAADHLDADRADAEFGIHVAGGEGVVQKAPRGSRSNANRGRWASAEVVAPGGNVIDDTFTRTVNTHDVKEDVTMTEASRHLGRIPRRAIDRALRENQPISEVIERHRNKMKQRRDGGAAARYEVQQAPSKPKVIYSSKSHKKIVDTEDVHNISRRGEDGKVYTETIKNQQHEVFDDHETPDDENKTSGTESDKMIKDTQRYRHTKKDEFTDFYRVPKHRGAELQSGAQLVAHGPHVTTEERQMERGEHDWEALEEKILRNRERMRQRLRGNGCGEPDRADALTKKPLNYHHEEKTRRKETDKWLERHFGSDWSLLTSSNNAATATGHSRVLRHHFTTPGPPGGGGGAKAHGNNVRRSMSFSSIPIAYTNPRERGHHAAAGGPNAMQVAAAAGGSGNNETETEEETKTVERRKVITTKTTTFSPSGERTVHREVKHIEEPTQRFRTQQRTHRNRQPQPLNHRQYNSTLSLSTPKADFALRNAGAAGSGGAHRSRKSQLCHEDAFCSTQSLNRRDQRRSYYYGDNSHHHQTQEDEDLDRHFDSQRHHDHNHHRRHGSAAAEQSMQQGGHHGYHGSRREHIVEERYSAHHRSESSPPMVRSKKVVPTWERQSRNDGRAVYRSDSTAGRSRKGERVTGSSVPRTPIYITEFTKEKLYPAKSENNLLSSGFSSGFHSRHREEQLGGGGGFGFTQRYEESFQRPTDYLGFRSMERHDGIGDSHRVRGRSAESSSWMAEERSSDNSSRARARQHHKQQQQKRSHSFVDARAQPPPRHHLFQDDFVYDRDERKFVSSSGMKHGHSNLRLDASATLPTRGRHHGHPHAARGEGEYAAAAGAEGITGLRQWHSREIMHQQEQLEPQRFKTIIFLSGS